MVLAVFAADTHISEATWSHTSRSAIRGDSFWGFEQLISLCVQHKCPLVLAGDCLELAHDPRPSTVTVEFIRSQVERLSAAGQKLYYILGQHDKNENPSWLSAIHSDCIHFGNQYITLGEVKFYGVDFFDGIYAKSVLPTIPSDMFGLVVHSPWAEFSSNKGITELSLTSLPEVPVVISGDTHECKYANLGSRLCISPGATHMRTLREPVNHFCLLLQDNYSFEVHTLSSRSVINFAVADPNLWTSHLENLTALADSQYKEQRGKGVPDNVARPLIIVDVMVKFDGENIIKERVNTAHVVFKGVADAGVSSTIFDAADLSLNQSDGAFGELLLQSLGEVGATDVQKAICVGMSRGESVLELLRHYAKVD